MLLRMKIKLLSLSVPAAYASRPERRRAHVLGWIQAALIVFLIAVVGIVLGFEMDYGSKLTVYLILLAGLLAGILIAFILNRMGKYSWSAGITVFCSFAGPWLSILLDSSVKKGDFVPLTYLTVSIILCATFLPSLVTVILTVTQFIGITLLVLSNPLLQQINLPSFYSFLLVIFTVSIVEGNISKNDQKQMEAQARALVEADAKLRDMAFKDSLTGLYNVRYLNDLLEREMIRSDRKRLPIGIIMMDIDHFKKINDTHGHNAGDVLLFHVGVMLLEHIRKSDIACRYGGDEFILVLPETSSEVVMLRAQQIRNNMKAMTAKSEEFTFDEITVSIGVAVYPTHGATFSDVLKKADAALYEAKRAGRDRVVLADDQN